MSDKFIITADELSREDWKYLFKNLKWLKGCTGKDDAGEVLQGVCRKDDKMYGCDGVIAAVWKPSQAQNKLMPNGIWFISTLNTNIIVAEPVDGSYPDVDALFSSDNRPTCNEAGRLTIDLAIAPNRLAQLTKDFTYMRMRIGETVQQVYLTNDWNTYFDITHCENYGLIMGIRQKETYSSLVITVEQPKGE